MECSRIQRPSSYFVLILFVLGCGSSPELDPRISSNWIVRKTTETSGATSYIFDVKRVLPPLSLKFDSSLVSTADVNAVLSYLSLPEVSQVRPDRGKQTGSRVWRGSYHWEDYALGSLTIQRTSGRNKNTGKNYDAIWKVTIQKN